MDSDEEALLLAIIIRRRRKRRKRLRTNWVTPLLSARLQKGIFHTLYDDLRQDDEQFFQYFRMSKQSFDELLAVLEVDISGSNTVMRRCIPAEEKLALTLRYLATGCSMLDLHFQYRIGTSTVTVIIRRVCKAIWRLLKNACFPSHTEEQWLETAEGFKKKSNFPNCIGAIDGKHIRIIKPTHTGSLYYNYKHFFSLLLLAVCDSNYRFLYIDVGAYGKSSDATIFKNSVLHRKLNEDTLNIPEGRPLYEGSNVITPFVIIGDEGFGLSKFVLRPYGGKFLSIKKRVFNYRLSRARRYIECTFGILANKWRIFHRPLDVSVDFAEDIVKTCCLLHNFVRERDGYLFEDTLTVEGFHNMAPNPTQGGRPANDVRDHYANYFVSEEGQVPWQLNKI